MKKISFDNIYNCILTGAVGDALGTPVRDLSYDLIVEEYGKSGINDMLVDCDDKARISANTQLNIFSIDALIRIYTKYYMYNISDIGKSATYISYLRWQYNQGRKVYEEVSQDFLNDNYLLDIQELKYERFAEREMIQVLENEMCKDDESLNSNKGFACITKSAIYGLIFYENDETAFNMSVKIAKLTHGHPSAYLSCGVLSAIIANIVKGKKLYEAIQNAVKILKKHENRSEVLNMIDFACKLAKNEIHYPEKFDEFGLCDDAHEVLGAAIYVSLICQNNIAQALVYSVNNSCFGNNIACVVGQILGLYKGIDIQIIDWSKKMELSNLIKEISYDLSLVVNKTIPVEIDNYDQKLSIEQMKYANDKNVASWWLLKYDKL